MSKQSDELSVIARQCIAAVCFERYCEHHDLKHPDIRAFIDHIWRVGAIESPDQFIEWEQGFQWLSASGWGAPIPQDVLDTIPPATRQEYKKLAEYVIETSATTWYGSNMQGTREYLLKVIRIVSAYGIELPNFGLFKHSSAEFHGGWGNNPSPDLLYAWRYNS
jgi:hypothetical protein